MKEGFLPPRPGEAVTILGDKDKIFVDIQGHRFELDIIQALALVSTVAATLEVYLRSKA